MSTEVYDFVRERHSLPFDLRPYQVETLEQLAPIPRTGYWLDMGLGKTVTSAIACLYKLARGEVQHAVVIMPPILIKGWGRLLRSIGGVTVTEYEGSPAKRKTLQLNANFTLMSYQIFKIDYDRISKYFAHKTVALIVDESTSIKNVGTAIYRHVRDFSLGDNHLLMLSGSPVSRPDDAYAPIKLKTPTVYRSLGQFEQIHVASRDFFNKPTDWRNLDMLQENLMLQSVRMLKEDVLKDMPAVTYQPVYYAMDKKHATIYRTLVDQQLLKYDNGEKLDVTEASALFNALQQVPVNREHFTQEEGVQSAALDVVHQLMDELGDGKLVIFTNYRLTNRLLSDQLAKYKAVCIYGEVSAKGKEEALQTFINDKECRVIVCQSRSAGFGVDGLQAVSSSVLFLELPYTPPVFHQAIARLHRIGQTKPVTVYVAIAEKTIQVRLWDVLQEKDTLVNTCIRGVTDLRDALNGVASA